MVCVCSLLQILFDLNMILLLQSKVAQGIMDIIYFFYNLLLIKIYSNLGFFRIEDEHIGLSLQWIWWTDVFFPPPRKNKLVALWHGEKQQYAHLLLVPFLVKLATGQFRCISESYSSRNFQILSITLDRGSVVMEGMTATDVTASRVCRLQCYDTALFDALYSYC